MSNNDLDSSARDFMDELVVTEATGKSTLAVTCEIITRCETCSTELDTPAIVMTNDTMNRTFAVICPDCQD